MRSLNNNSIVVILLILLSYSTYYICRLNFSFSTPYLSNEYNYTKVQIGVVFTTFSIIYGICKLISGILADRYAAPHKIIVFGLLGTAALNLCIPMFFSSFIILCFLCAINGIFQSMGWPPSVKIINQRFAKNEIGFVWGVCNSAHAVGGIIIATIASFLISYHKYEYIFYIPAIISILVALVILSNLKKLNVENKIELTKSSEKFHFLKIPNLSIKAIFLMCISTLFLYIIRIGILNWLPLFFLESRDDNVALLGMQYSGFEFCGIIGGILSGYLSDRVGIRHRYIIACFSVFFMICIFGILVISITNSSMFLLCICFLGAFLYGPQILGGVISNDYIPSSYSASVTGLVGLFGYIGSSIAGLGIGAVIDIFGWQGLFIVLLISSICCFCCFFCFKFLPVENNSKNTLSSSISSVSK